MKIGTRIELHGTPEFGVEPEMAVIAKTTAKNLPMPDGYHLVKFADGGKLCVHESRFRIIDNRARERSPTRYRDVIR